jgi:hypothetical protein
MKNSRRWSDDQRCWGPFTYSRDQHGKPFGAVIDSGEREYGGGCHIRLRGFGHTIIVELPPLVRPLRNKIVARWDASTILRMGRDWYWDEHRREYGFQISDGGFLHVFMGTQTGDSSTTQDWCCYLPFADWRFVRFSLYDGSGEHLKSWDETSRNYGAGFDRFKDQYEYEAAMRKERFLFADFDGQEIEAATCIQEREWRFGTKWCRWLSVFRKPKIRRSLDIDFSKEVGPRKGSWKGGTLGHGIEMRPTELHRSAFLRYCHEHKLTFLRALP